MLDDATQAAPAAPADKKSAKKSAKKKTAKKKTANTAS